MPLAPLASLLDLTDKTAIVTGGAVGIGQGISYRLAEAGAQVVIADNRSEHLEEARQFFAEHAGGLKLHFERCDVADEVAVNEVIESTVHAYGGVDILVNNAGIYPNILVMNMTAADFQRVIDVNLKGVFLASKAAGARMIARGVGGRIINITSIDALHPSSAGLAHYDASKHGVWGFTKNLALELAPHGIWVNAVAPGGIATPGVREVQQSMDIPSGIDMSQLLDAFLARIPMRRMGEPDDVARAVLFLASDLSSYMTGTQIIVDGGVLLS